MDKKKIGKTVIKYVLFLFGIALSLVGMYYFHGEFTYFQNPPMMALLTFLSMLGTGIIAALASISSEKSSKKKTVITAIVTALICGALVWGIACLIKYGFGNGGLEYIAVEITIGVITLFTGILCAVFIIKNFKKKYLKAILSVVTLICFIIGSGGYLYVGIFEWVYIGYKAPIPVIEVKSGEMAEKNISEGDFFVSTNGNDSNDGSYEAPFLTIERAVEAVRNTDKENRSGINVFIEAGEYRVSSLVFGAEDSGTAECPITYYGYGDGEVVLNGGVTLSPNDFKSVSEYPAISERLTDDAKNNVVVIDLTAEPYCLAAEDWGKIYAIGSYNTAESYDGDWSGPLYCELFVNDERQTLARYPDSEFLYTEEVVSTGLGKESDGSTTEVENWEEIRNPEPDVYKVNSDLSQRIAGWKTLDDVWMFGYWKYDWADASSPIGSFDEATGEISPAFVSLYGTKTEAPYYFFNVLEELSAEGEWYLDRETGLLCMWKSENFQNAVIDISISFDSVINAEADNLVFDGMTIKGTRGNGITVTGDNNTVRNCLVKNVAENAIVMTGYNNTVFNNEITRTGKGGIILTGGDTETLTPGNCVADNNYIHDWSEIYLTYQPGVTLNGVGNVCSHNEMVNAPHEAITYTGNNHIIEYNLIHDVCILSDDAGAIYAGRSWIWYGNVIRYNCIYNIGSEDHSPDGIYLDDALSGQQVYGNILVNIPRNAILIGGGRDNEVTNNIIINAGDCPIYFDDRARDAALNSGWFTHAHVGSGDMWDALYDSPWQSEIWQEAFPQYKNCSDDIEQADSSAYIPNPSSTVKGNLIFDKKVYMGEIVDSAYTFGDISDNGLYYLWSLDDFFVDAENGVYVVEDLDKVREDAPGFENIPLEDIGRTIYQ